VPCAHKQLKKQLVGGQFWYKCEACPQKFKAELWDGKVEAAAPVTGPDVAQQVEKLREYIHATYNGGHHENPALDAFHHGMDTVCNQLGNGKWLERAIRTALEEQAAQLLADLENGRGNFDELQRKNYLLRKAESETRQLREETERLKKLLIDANKVIASADKLIVALLAHRKSGSKASLQKVLDMVAEYETTTGLKGVLHV
jgi:hypothetical protein